MAGQVLPVGERVPASRTVRRLVLAMVVLAVLGLIAGVSGVTSVQSRAGSVADLEARDGPLVVAAQNLYSYLSDADATAANAFLTDGPEPPQLRARYQRDLAEAGAALARVSSGAQTGPAAVAVSVLSVQLPVYAGLVETARAFHRQGLPVGAAYLREASGLMRQTLLPAAQQLFDAVSADLAQAREAAGGFPWFAAILGLVLLGVLVGVQLQLARRTHRVFNIGLVVATVAALASVLWLGLSWSSASHHLDASHRDGSAQVALLSQARIAALQASSDEAHTLVAVGAGAAYEESFQAQLTRLLGEDGRGGLLAQAGAADAAAAAQQWQAIHQQVRELDDGGDHAGAVELAIGTETGSAASAAARLDGLLASEITAASERLADEASLAGRAYGGVSLGLALLTGLLLIGVVVGIQQRVSEYR